MSTDDPKAPWVVHANVTIKGERKLVTVRCKHASPLGAAEQTMRELHARGVASGDVQAMHVDRA